MPAQRGPVHAPGWVYLSRARPPAAQYKLTSAYPNATTAAAYAATTPAAGQPESRLPALIPSIQCQYRAC
jgi:hypothetical protein